MSEWESRTVAELQADGVLLVEDGNHGEYRPRPTEFVEEGTAFIRAADLSDGEVQFAKAGKINGTALKRVRKGIGKAGDVLFSHKGTVGKLARVPANAPPFVCSPQTTFWRVLDDERIDRSYLYAYMRSQRFIDQWWVRKGETDMADYVSLTAQRQLRIVLPPRSIQAEIAGPLLAVDDLIVNNRQRIGLLERMARAVYQEWFVRFRYPGRENVLLVDSPEGLIPDGWELARVEDTVQALTRGIAPKYANDGAWTVLNQKCVRDNRVDFRSARRQERLPTPDKRVRLGDILVNSTGVGTLGRCAIYIGRHPTLTVDSHVTIVRPVDLATSLWLAMSLFERQGELESLGTGSTGQTELSRRDIGALSLILPPPHILRLFADSVWPILTGILGLLDQNRAVAAARDLLLPKLVSGEIDVSQLDLNELVGSVA